MKPRIGREEPERTGSNPSYLRQPSWGEGETTLPSFNLEKPPSEEGLKKSNMNMRSKRKTEVRYH